VSTIRKMQRANEKKLNKEIVKDMKKDMKEELVRKFYEYFEEYIALKDMKENPKMFWKAVNDKWNEYIDTKLGEFKKAKMKTEFFAFRLSIKSAKVVINDHFVERQAKLAKKES